MVLLTMAVDPTVEIEITSPQVPDEGVGVKFALKHSSNSYSSIYDIYTLAGFREFELYW